MTDRGLDEPVPADEPIPDVAEQKQDAVPGADENADTEYPQELPLEADVADASEQARVVELGDEDYR
ncbi:MAG TPA: hypothetical protein VF834_05475 [Streptosporangiaceae bacterium]